jgi:glycosyltransferase involved in cell wall biosynthesis
MALRCAIGRRRPTVVTQHVGVIKLRSRVLNALQERMLIRKAEWAMRGGALLTFVGKAVRDWFLSKAIIPEDRVFMTPAGIDAADYHLVTTEERWGFRTKWGLNGGDFGVLCVGRFYEKKGLPLIREAARILSDVKFTLVGKGPLQVSGWGLPNVRIIDFVSNAELRELYGAHDLFIMPSHGEGWPAVVPQAMACGLPCLISEETFQGYDRDAQMFLTCERSPESLGRNIRNARTRMRAPLDDRGTVSRYALEHWDWRRTAAVYLDLFGRAMCGTPATGTLPGC